ncbi:MAG: tRNA threonylcarbamoyladenosine dehydratase [Clostridiales Family XIII bacterium]|jgi:tRNA A37 threonylcarbamoyladenosine dehydratase|nr:tRNA threonylcarbamoyladenosine dehydratase [Clostridiales Family XIII bacterium]
MNQFSRTELLLGQDGMRKLSASAVIVFGIGGVGSYAAEALARSGVGRIGLVDDDKVCVTNINRQLIATINTVGRDKIEVMKDRILEINPDCIVDLYPVFYGPDTVDEIDLSIYDYVIDAIDTVTAKLVLIERAKAAGAEVISCMGAGNKLDPTAFKIADISKTSYCPLAKVMRKELRMRGIEGVKVVYSEEEVLTPQETEALSCKFHCICPPGATRNCMERRQIPGSIAFVPSVAGLIIASEVVKDLTRETVGAL